LGWRPLINHLGTDRPVLGVTLPRKNGIPQPFSDIESLAAYQIEQMCAVEPEGPYHVVGYSFGATVALEIAQQLVTSGREVGLLGAIDSGPVPRYLNGEPSPSHFTSFTRNLYFWFIDNWCKTHPREMFARAYRRLKMAAERVGIVPSSPPPSPLLRALKILEVEKLPGDLQRVIEINYRARMSYQPRPYPGQVTLFRVRADSMFRPLEHDLGWGRFALGGVEVFTISGNHWNIIEDPRVQKMADQLRKCLDAVDQSSLASHRSPSSVDVAAGQLKPNDRDHLVRAGPR